MDLKADIAESTTTGLKTGIDDTTGFNSPKLLQIYSSYSKVGKQKGRAIADPAHLICFYYFDVLSYFLSNPLLRSLPDLLLGI